MSEPSPSAVLSWLARVDAQALDRPALALDLAKARGNQRQRVAALRRWIPSEDEQWRVLSLYLEDEAWL